MPTYIGKSSQSLGEFTLENFHLGIDPSILKIIRSFNFLLGQVSDKYVLSTFQNNPFQVGSLQFCAFCDVRLKSKECICWHRAAISPGATAPGSCFFARTESLKSTQKASFYIADYVQTSKCRDFFPLSLRRDKYVCAEAFSEIKLDISQISSNMVVILCV